MELLNSEQKYFIQKAQSKSHLNVTCYAATFKNLPHKVKNITQHFITIKNSLTFEVFAFHVKPHFLYEIFIFDVSSLFQWGFKKIKSTYRHTIKCY